MNRDKALEEFFNQADRWFRKPVQHSEPTAEGEVRVYFNNEYSVLLPLEVVKTLWPDSEENDEI